MIGQLNLDARNRVLAINKLQLDTNNLQVEFNREVYEMQQKFQQKRDELFKKRSAIINGAYEPTDDECKFPGQEIQAPHEGEPNENQEKPFGITNFWLATLKNASELKLMIEAADEEVLKNLIDVRAHSKPSPDLLFQLEFVFAPNEFFANDVLTKTYLMKCSPEPEDPFNFEGPEIYKSGGCEIAWKAGKSVSDAPFFNIFNSTKDNDWNEFGKVVKMKVIPRAMVAFLFQKQARQASEPLELQNRD